MVSVMLDMAASRFDWIAWGDAPSWGALAFTILAARIAYRVYRIESRRDQRAEEERRGRESEGRQSQAALVCAWYGQSGVTEPSPLGRVVVRHEWGAYVRNASPLPIYGLRIAFYYLSDSDGPARRAEIERPLIAPSPEPVFIHPGVELRVPAGTSAGEPPVVTEAINRFGVTVEFTDAANRRWLRDLQGCLLERPQPGSSARNAVAADTSEGAFPRRVIVQAGTAASRALRVAARWRRRHPGHTRPGQVRRQLRGNGGNRTGRTLPLACH